MIKPSARTVFSSIAIGIAVVHMLIPSLAIDSVTISLLLIAAIPWLGRFLKSLELVNIGKLEFRDLLRIEKQAAATELGSRQAAKPDVTGDQYLENVAERDPNLALAGIRLELERKLGELAEAAELKTTRKGTYLLAELEAANALFGQEFYVFKNFFSLLNAAVHGASVDRAAAEKALTMGRNLLESLDERIKLVRSRRASKPGG